MLYCYIEDRTDKTVLLYLFTYKRNGGNVDEYIEIYTEVCGSSGTL